MKFNIKKAKKTRKYNLDELYYYDVGGMSYIVKILENEDESGKYFLLVYLFENNNNNENWKPVSYDCERIINLDMFYLQPITNITIEV